MRKYNKYIELEDGYAIELYSSNTYNVLDYAYISKIDFKDCKSIFWRKTEYGYARGYYNKKEILLHKFITKTDNSIIIDHKDRNKLNCTRENLRVANKQINSLNRDAQLNSKTGFSGISFDKRRNKFRAYTKKDGIQINFGSFNTIEEAIKARKEKLQIIFGDIDTTN